MARVESRLAGRAAGPRWRRAAVPVLAAALAVAGSAVLASRGGDASRVRAAGAPDRVAAPALPVPTTVVAPVADRGDEAVDEFASGQGEVDGVWWQAFDHTTTGPDGVAWRCLLVKSSRMPLVRCRPRGDALGPADLADVGTRGGLVVGRTGREVARVRVVLANGAPVEVIPGGRASEGSRLFGVVVPGGAEPVTAVALDGAGRELARAPVAVIPPDEEPAGSAPPG